MPDRIAQSYSTVNSDDLLTNDGRSLTRARVRCGACDFEVKTELIPDYCPRCNTERLWIYPPRPLPLSEQPSDAKPIIYRPSALFSEVFPLGVPAVPMLWAGGRGSGKSRLSMRLGVELGHCAFISYEMSTNVLLSIAQSACPSGLSRLVPFDDLESFYAEKSRRFEVVVIDSVQYLGPRWQRAVNQLHRYSVSNDCVVIWISQLNSKGQPKGGPSLAHAVDCELTISGGNIPGTAIVRTPKNRLSLPVNEAAILQLAE